MKNRKRWAALTLVLFLSLMSACTKPSEDKGYDIAGKTYYDTVDNYGHEDHSKVWFGKDGSFVLNDSHSEGYEELNGTWELKENVITLTADGSSSKILFEIQNEDTLKLRTSLKGSKADHLFSIHETKGSDGKADTDTKPEKDPIPFTYAVYYNTSQSSKEKSYCELRSDMSFAFIDKNDFGISEYNGTYTQKDDVLTLSGGGKTIEFLIKDAKNLVLQNDVGISATGDLFSADYVPPKEVPCTALTSLYNNYWATEGVSGYDLQAKPTPLNTTDKITYSSDDEKVVKVDEIGRCTAVAPGTTKIHIRCGSIERVVGFETKPKKVDVSSVSVDKDKLVIMMNSSGKINGKVSPENATDQSVFYKSNDPRIAKVDSNGNVTGVQPGITEIYVSASNGKQTVCKVCVEGETVLYQMENNVSVKASSGQKIPYKATWVMCYDFSYSTQDVTTEVEFHTAYTSALDIDGYGNVYAKGAIYDTVDVPIYFTFSDGSSFYVRSQDFTVHVVK